MTRFGGMPRRIAATGVLALAVLGLSGPAASAGEPEKIVAERGEARFFDRGDKIGVFDTREDGRGVRAYLRWGTRTQSVFVNNRRGGKRVAERIKNLDIPERTTVEIELCYTTKRGIDDRCSDTQHGKA